MSLSPSCHFAGDFVVFVRQVSYQVGCFEIVKHTVTELWNHFIDLRTCFESGWIQRTSDMSDFTLTVPRSVGLMTELTSLSLIKTAETRYSIRPPDRLVWDMTICRSKVVSRQDCCNVNVV